MDNYRLLFEYYGTEHPVTAELQSIMNHREIGTFIHTQDFYEIMYVIEGEGFHWINGDLHTLEPGRLLFITPKDSHDVVVKTSSDLHFFNISMRSDFWLQLCDMIKIDPSSPWGLSVNHDEFVDIPYPEREECNAMFRQYVPLLCRDPSHFNLFRFTAAVLPYLRQVEAGEAETKLQPGWLISACHAMRTLPNVAAGLPRFVELSGVSATHLSRVLKATTGQSPTEFINARRLKWAATILAITSTEITDIAMDCGFESLSYFFRLFRKRYGKTPLAYRKSMRQMISAENMPE